MFKQPEDVCYLCLRIPASEVLRLAHKLWQDPEVARRMGLEAAETIREVYKKNPTYFCGRQKNSIVAGLFYYLGVILKERIRQKDIAEVLQVADITVRHVAQHWYRLFHGSEDNFYRKYMPAIQRQRETVKSDE
jgi:transcription initiation factor TFIIIB Brf1 subunit/transcription initiation factor TFIIB